MKMNIYAKTGRAGHPRGRVCHFSKIIHWAGCVISGRVPAVYKYTFFCINIRWDSAYANSGRCAQHRPADKKKSPFGLSFTRGESNNRTMLSHQVALFSDGQAIIPAPVTIGEVVGALRLRSFHFYFPLSFLSVCIISHFVQLVKYFF